MSSEDARFFQNSSIVHPERFFISGLSGIPYSTYYYIFLFVMYFIGVIGNSMVIFIVAFNRRLHSPKYIGVLYLALNDMGKFHALCPNLFKVFLFDSHYISYNACMANMFFVHFFGGMQCHSLVVLAYDRFVAICLPLRYNAIVNNTVISLMFLVLWTFNGCLVMFVVLMITRLSFCKSIVIPSYFCDHGPVYRLACNDNSINNFLATLCTALYLIGPLIIIVLSYLGIFLALSKITTWEGRLKALKTCVSHLLTVGIFFIPITSIYIVALMISFPLNIRVFSTSLSRTVPPMINPFIYVLNTAEIKDIIRKFIKNRSARIKSVTTN